MRRRALATGLVILLAAGLSACASGPDLQTRRHTVQKGENLYRISKRYGTTVDALARANRLADPTQIRVGQRLYIPSRNGASSATANTYARSDRRGRSGKVVLRWPIDARVASGFGIRGGAHHDGIDIPARPGTAIRAAGSGRVIHSDSKLAGYGNMIIIKHTGNISTVYAHNRKNKVRVGQFVEKGEIIAEVGSTGRTTAPHLHFEVRRDGRPRDPLHYLP